VKITFLLKVISLCLIALFQPFKINTYQATFNIDRRHEYTLKTCLFTVSITD